MNPTLTSARKPTKAGNLLHLLLVLLLASCTLPDDSQRAAAPAPHGATAAYLITSYQENGKPEHEWEVSSYKQGYFPPRCSFKDPATGKSVTLTGTFSVESLELPKPR